ncbi:DsbC/DsbD-like thiol-disulfide interchange protein [Bartonella fuyuanensis]|uniref:DsbC/DsbD-like thiol-disulfide interchange protein n=1 Tax=Bartonella fuyuanensis TaxID=1460968 RepID=A0A840DUP7_9HYPH|nr:protein-disulfide reductase DsbD domain-containing protein [Bartonella fuyuanensis]MBB4076690.1 DsbC/DsbD-like thiol-disulfide interchange protein [Bartonella fuyuanensis]
MKKSHIFTNLQNIAAFFYKKLLVTLSLTFLILELLNIPVNAQREQKLLLFATPWHESDGGRIRLAITEPSPSEISQGIIEIMLKPGWKTYWRNPGSSGMAPFFNFNQQVSYEIFYPTPQAFETENNWSLGYKDKVILPFNLFGSRKNLRGAFTLGFCNKICIPFTMNFDFSPSAFKNKQLPASFLKNAQDSLPRMMQNALKISAEKNNNTLLIKIQNNNKNTPASLFLDGGEMQIGVAKKVSDNAEYTLFSAPLYFVPEKTNQKIFYTVSFKDYALSGTFTFQTQLPPLATP